MAEIKISNANQIGGNFTVDTVFFTPLSWGSSWKNLRDSKAHSVIYGKHRQTDYVKYLLSALISIGASRGAATVYRNIRRRAKDS